MSSHSPFPLLNLPEELIESIMYHTVYEGDEFSALKVDYDDITERGSPFSERQEDFARDVLLVCKVCYRIGQPLLWRFVVVKTMGCLEILAAQVTRRYPTSTTSLPTHTRRLQIRLFGAYDGALVQELINAMTNLHILVVHNRADYQGRHNPPCLSAIANCVASTTSLRRIQFDSLVEVPSLQDVVAILGAIPNLRTLRCAAHSSINIPSQSLSVATAPHPHPLVSISLGTPPPSARPTDVPQATVLDIFCATDVGEFPFLRKIHLLQYHPRSVNLLAKFGPQLHTLLYSTPALPHLPSPSTNFLAQCPNLRLLVWVVSSWRSLGPCHEIPSAHSQLRVVTIVCSENQWQASQCSGRIQAILDVLEGGSFPRLKYVVLQLGNGAYETALEGKTWFRARRRSLARLGVQLRKFNEF